jgi:protein TonB
VLTEEERSRKRLINLALAMILSVWLHVIGLAVLQYQDPLPAVPTSVPLMLEIELPPPEPEPKPEPETKPEPPKETVKPEPPTPPEPEKTAEAEPTKGALVPSTPPEVPPGEGRSDVEGLPPEEETISIESTAPKYLSYLAQVKAGVRNHWIFPPQAREKRATGRLTAVFTIDKTGKLLRIVVEESSGFPILDHAAMEAVRGASPFPPFPDHITLERLNIRAMFDYRIKYINVQ